MEGFSRDYFSRDYFVVIGQFLGLSSNTPYRVWRASARVLSNSGETQILLVQVCLQPIFLTALYQQFILARTTLLTLLAGGANHGKSPDSSFRFREVFTLSVTWESRSPVLLVGTIWKSDPSFALCNFSSQQLSSLSPPDNGSMACFASSCNSS